MVMEVKNEVQENKKMVIKVEAVKMEEEEDKKEEMARKKKDLGR